MAKAITIFTILSGAASTLGFVFVFFGTVTPIYKKLCTFGFGVAALWAAYVLFVPATSVESNVAGKISYYNNPSADRRSDTLLIQRGEISFSDFGPKAVEFPLPFRTVPDVEIINSGGYPEQSVPRIEKVTAHQVIFRRDSVGGTLIPEGMQVYHWVARGVPLDELVPKK
jgi:hypothetical protein